MAMADTLTTTRQTYLEWGPIFAGAVAAASLSFLLLTFGGAVGLSLTSPWPDTGARVWVVALAVAWWMVLVQIASFAAGGYLAGRMRSRWGDARSAEGEFRDSTHGFMVWAVGVLMGALALAFVGLSTAKTASESASTVAAGTLSGNAAGKSAASGPSDYAVDLLFRPQPQQATPAARPAGNDEALRAEAGRIFLAAIKNQALTERDRNYLVQIVGARTGLPEAEAQRRVDAAVVEARDLELKARQAADKARKATVVTAFTAAISLLVSLVIAAAAASLGGRHRDENRIPHFAGHRFW
jgi:heme/copper-type cytochrome/quinol oxidase subunit 2